MEIMRHQQLNRGAILLAISLSLGGCARPQAPVVTPEVATVTGVSAAGLDLAVSLRVHNPNSFPLSVQAVNGTVWLDGGKRLGVGRAAPGQTLEADRSTLVESALRIAWSDLPAMTDFIGRSTIPYTFKGEVTLGGERLNLTLPFELRGQLTTQQLLSAGLRGLPSMVPPQR
jgi:LEA14-like dessication related protein